MSDEPKPGLEGKRSSRPTLAKASAANQLSHGFRARIAESIDSTGKALAVLAGFGAFFIAAGYFVEWQRFRQGRLPSEEVLPLIPKDQIAAAGARELVISFLFVSISLALLGFVLVRLARWTEGRPDRFAQALNRMLSRDIAFPTAIVGGVTLLIVPFNLTGIIVTAIVTGLFLYGLLLLRRFLEAGDHSRFPLWRLVLAIGIAAIVLAGARQFEFGEPRPDALVCLNDGSSFEGDYIASDSDKVLIRKRAAPADEAKEPSPRIGLRCAGEDRGSRRTGARRRLGKRPRLIVVPRDTVEEILLVKSYTVLPYHNSLLGGIISRIPWLSEAELSCIPPECRWRKKRIGPSSYL